MRVLIAPDSFKGSLSAADVAKSLATGWLKFRPNDTVEQVPIADGGEGTVDVLVRAWGGRLTNVEVTGPLGDPVRAHFGISPNGKTAVIEMAAASGLPLLDKAHLNPLVTTTYGTGELIRAALDAGARHIIVGVGGSATNDGGAGMARALGVRLLDASGAELPPGGAALLHLDRVDVSRLDERVQQTQFVVAADVDNPLVGRRGASHVFGPQKGASPDDVNLLDRALTRYAHIVDESLPLETRSSLKDLPGAGAAGGLAAGLVAFCGATLRSGADVVLEILDLEGRVRAADVVITGEGHLDGQSAFGKAPFAVAQMGQRWQTPVIAVAGALGSGSEELYEHGIAAAVAIAPGPIDAEESIERAAHLLVQCGERVARLVHIGYALTR